jgi:hypothetical protein
MRPEQQNGKHSTASNHRYQHCGLRRSRWQIRRTPLKRVDIDGPQAVIRAFDKRIIWQNVPYRAGGPTGSRHAHETSVLDAFEQGYRGQ